MAVGEKFSGGFQGDFFKNPPETRRQRVLPFVVQAETRKRGLFEKSPLLNSPKNFPATVDGMSGVCTQSNASAVQPRRKAAAKTFRQLSTERRASAPKVTRQPFSPAAGAAVLVRIMCRMTIIQHVKCTSAVNVHDSG